jgi:hypothetical protein
MLKNLHLYLYKKYSNLFCCLSLCSYSTIFSEKQKKNVMEKKNNEVLEATVEVLKVELLNIFPSKQIKLGKILLEIQNNIQSNMEKKKSEIFVKIKYKDIFETKRDLGNVKGVLFQVKKRVEPIETLYVTMGEARLEAEYAEKESKEDEAEEVMAREASKAAAASSKALDASVGPTLPTPEDAAKQGAIIGKAKKSFKLRQNPQSVGGSGVGPG